ncbi:MAG: hypothetical protein KDD45_17115, partial [Bdellovibrionales bacterium]|nr:hypothetical protein [Bdellovibrionales bacterium]
MIERIPLLKLKVLCLSILLMKIFHPNIASSIVEHWDLFSINDGLDSIDFFKDFMHHIILTK